MAACVLSVILLSAGDLAGRRTEPPTPRPFDSVLSRVVANLISTQHYARKPLDDQVSQQLFDEYFNTLDRERRFFLASDIAEFAPSRQALDNKMYAGELDFAFKVYERFVQRVRERVEFARRRLAEPFDFSLDEEIVLRRNDETPWCETVEELDDVWRKFLKNRVLIFTLMAAPDEDAVEASADAGENDGDKDEVDETVGETVNVPFVQKTPVERVLQAQERFLAYVEENDSIDVLEQYLSSLARIYDPHSSYMAPMTEEDFDINMRLSLEGIGAVLSTEEGHVKIVDIIEGGPAELDGRLKAGDRILAVAQEDAEVVDVVDMPLRKVVRLIRGPKGTSVYLSVIEAGRALGSVPTTIDIVRDEVKLSDRGAKSETRIMQLPTNGEPGSREPGTPAKVSIVTLPTFYSDFSGKRRGDPNYRSSSRDVRNLLEAAVEQGADGVVLDLRSNGGGSLEEAVELAGLFISEGPVVQVKGTGMRHEVHADKSGEAVYDGPLVIMVNRMSASASEIVAAAIQDHHRGVIVGDASTHGKGTVQTVYDLQRLFSRDPVFRNEAAGALKFTIAKFYRVNGESTQKRGVTPDIVFPAFSDHMDIGEAHLNHALQWDKIEPLERNRDVDISPYLPILKQRFEARIGEDPVYQSHVEAVEHYGELRQRETTPLNIDSRRELQRQEAKWQAKIRHRDDGEAFDFTEDADDEATDPDAKAADLVLDESLRILGDLIWLNQGDRIADPKANPLGATGE